jgi:ATP-dependent helicase/nuclease subunit A
MQSLPDVAPERRRDAAYSFLRQADASLDAQERERLAAQALAILAHPRFAPVFASGSRAEVPLVGRFTGTDGREIRVSGQIDRLLVTADGVLITDYKSDRDPPQNPEQTPPAYVRQLALYRAVLRKLYPDRPIRAALLWTEIPDLMEIPPALLDQAALSVIG